MVITQLYGNYTQLLLYTNWFNVQGINGFITKFIRTLQHPITLSGEPTLLVSSPPRRAIPRESCNSFTGFNTTPLITHKQEQ